MLRFSFFFSIAEMQLLKNIKYCFYYKKRHSVVRMPFYLLLKRQMLKLIQLSAAVAPRYENFLNADNDIFISRLCQRLEKLFISFTRAIIFNASNLVFMLIFLFI